MAKMMASGVPSPCTMYAPLAQPSIEVPAWLGITWRESASVEGRGLPEGVVRPRAFSTAACGDSQARMSGRRVRRSGFWTPEP